ncbi:hypothetical protein AUP68_01273 [Ilyonectria robusta]
MNIRLSKPGETRCRSESLSDLHDDGPSTWSLYAHLEPLRPRPVLPPATGEPFRSRYKRLLMQPIDAFNRKTCFARARRAGAGAGCPITGLRCATSLGHLDGPPDQESIGRMDFQPCAASHHCTAYCKQVIGDQLGTLIRLIPMEAAPATQPCDPVVAPPCARLVAAAYAVLSTQYALLLYKDPSSAG